ncbi:MAG: aspartyl/asparaginyl beta-hydroxylase domain-containing protein [Erythrobacter sp.]|nr:aspartyl/asparaginyl beta-hydroxylase domain-containing protein [Erythrobacter sp.]MDZ4275223.1 aspartyl/asparaginyl beta-hydroxylase domain-containing protein [Erythrobacter sp.]
MAIDQPDPAFDEAEADRRLESNRRDVEAMMAKADNRMRAADYRAANAYYGQIARLAAAGVSVAHGDLNRARDATLWLAERFRLAILEGLAARGVDQANMHPSFAKSLAIMFGQEPRAAEFIQYPQSPNLYFYPDLPHVEYADAADHGWVKAVEAQTDTILAEAQVLLAQGKGFGPYVKTDRQRPQGDVHGMLEDPSWSTLDLTDRGIPVPERVAQAPKTWATMQENVPLCDIPRRAPSVMFSLLRAGSRIPPHTGMINSRFICHLPLIVPGDGALRVGTSQRAWEHGKVMIFDDSVEHEAWNNAAKDRLVLIFDIWRPEISEVERAQIKALFASVDDY